MPTILVIFGATGDLSRTKLIPALFHLHRKKALPPLFQIIGFSRRDLGDQGFRDFVRDVLKKDSPINANAEDIESFLPLAAYQQGFFDKRQGYKKLAKRLGYQDKQWRTCANKLFHLAVPPSYYKNIFRSLAASGLTEPCSAEEGWTRVLVEKPFGKDLSTAEALDEVLGKLFKEEQIYRIDHYLGKETVQNILAFRFSNSFFDPAWNKDSIERIHISLLEAKGVEERGEFYDGIGALRDVGQNHLSQLLALFMMERPAHFNAESIRSRRAEVLHALHIPDEEEISELTVRGQYAGYTQLPHVRPNSDTETYFRIQAMVDTPRWEGVPVILESGKQMNESKVEVEIAFRHPRPCLCPTFAKASPFVKTTGDESADRPERHFRNVLRYEIQPNEQIRTSFWVKKPGKDMILEEKDFVFNYKQAYPEAAFNDPYEKLILAAIEGDQTLFVSTDEIMASWRYIDPIIRAWSKNKAKLLSYHPGSGDIQDIHLRIEDAFLRGTMYGKKEIGIIGLGKMGKNMALRLRDRGWNVVAYDANPDTRGEVGAQGIHGVENIEELIRQIETPRIVWLMVPSYAKATEGKARLSPVDDVLFGEDGLVRLLKRGDVIIDGGNSFYEDSIRRGKKLAKHGIHFLDVGVSGGPEGARNGASLMVGGEKKIYIGVEHLFRELSVPNGFGYMGQSGAGHFVKMVHNGIEYGMMQSIAEGFAILKKYRLGLDLKKVADVYNHGSVIESRLIGWLKKAFEEYGEDLDGVSGTVGHTGEGEWTIKTAKKLGIDVPAIKDALEFRIRSAKTPTYTAQILSVLRSQFGGHSVK